MRFKILTILPAVAALSAWEGVPAAHAGNHALRLAPTYQLLTGSPFAGTGNDGTGLTSTWERMLTDKFGFGINLAWRTFPAGQAMTQIGYGLVLKHYLNGEGARGEGIRPFLEYGLLLQISTLAGRAGSGTSHDTRLTAGADLPLFGAPLYGAASYHFSTLRYFENPSIDLNYLGLEFGVRFSWE